MTVAEVPLISVSAYTDENENIIPTDTKSAKIIEELVNTIKTLNGNNKTLLLFYSGSKQVECRLMNKSGFIF